ncbi:PREDICTED: disease resistance protein At4g27190 [Tarenaya hassleriana]|uniref:disease resistance protein At4g27190 n=1 Tax=Tarenaya hassleriana TaxID=28532 RepID=UPI00053C3A89|nr:PREDICTED: disease resistance protein At4g27190 [Tarenaya hassleriana]
MELLSSILGSILADTTRAMCGAISSRAIHTIRFKSNLTSLKNALDRLMEVAYKVDKTLETLEITGRSLQVQLRRWQTDVQEIFNESSSFQEKQSISCALSCRNGKDLVTILEKVETFEKLGKHLIETFHVDGSNERVEYIPGPFIQNQTITSQMLANIMDILKSEKVQKIGIWGMGGVGKTTLVTALNNKLHEEVGKQPFGMVIWATVSAEFDLRRVQMQIAERLGMVIKLEETDEKLARQIHRRLEKACNFLLILDDVWKPIDLNLLGIPQMKEHEASKVILTSRFLEVCRSMKTDVDIRVDCLDEEEAWQLFCQNAGEVASSDRIRPLAKAISLECGGLPLAIITVGTAMRGKKMVKLWKHALKELKRSVPWVKSIEENIYQPLKLSYDLLDDKMKPCFLFCALFPEDYSIEVTELVRYWIAEGFIDEQDNHKYSMNEGITLVENLKDACLLEEGARDGTVKMHDVVRDFALWVMSSSQDDCHSLIASGMGLIEIPQEKFVPSIRRVSLMNNKLERLPDCSAECEKVSAFLLQGNFQLQEVPVGFLQAFPALRILNLSGTHIKALPYSLSQLHNLHSLILRDCYYLEELPSLEALTKLQLLDLCATRIKEFPRGLEALSSLKLLDLSRTHYLESIPAGIISKLSNLEALDMTLSHYHWGIQGQVQEGQATLDEITHLHRLLVLSIRVVGIPSLSPENISWIRKLKKFQLFIGPTANSLPTRHDKRRVTISSLNVSEASIGWLLTNATSLVVNHCWGLNAMLENLVIDIESTSSFDVLRSLTIESFGSSLRPAGGCAAQLDLLPNLEELHLRGVNLETTRELVGHLGLRFESLKLLEVSRCRQLKCLLSVGNFICFLPNLQEIRVSFCDKLQVLFDYYPEIAPASIEPVVPNLRVIKLTNLPQLTRLCTEEETWGCLEQVEVIKCKLVKRLPINSKNAHRVKEIRGEPDWWNSLHWDNTNTKTTLQPRFISSTSDVFGVHDSSWK